MSPSPRGTKDSNVTATNWILLPTQIKTKTTYSEDGTNITNNRNKYVLTSSETTMYLILKKRKYLQPATSTCARWIHIHIVVIQNMGVDRWAQFTVSMFSHAVTSRFERYPPDGIIHMIYKRKYFVCIQILNGSWTLHMSYIQLCSSYRTTLFNECDSNMTGGIKWILIF
jgi:hypothetical protein